MALHTIALTAAQETVLKWVVEKQNAAKGTALTVDQFLQLQIPSLLQPYALQFAEAREEALVTRFRAAAEAQRAAAEEALK